MPTIGLTEDCCISEMRQMSQQERDQRDLASLEVEDRLGEDAESTEATPLRRYQMVEELLAPGFKWWAGMENISNLILQCS